MDTTARTQTTDEKFESLQTYLAGLDERLHKVEIVLTSLAIADRKRRFRDGAKKMFRAEREHASKLLEEFYSDNA